MLKFCNEINIPINDKTGLWFSNLFLILMNNFENWVKNNQEQKKNWNTLLNKLEMKTHDLIQSN